MACRWCWWWRWWGWCRRRCSRAGRVMVGLVGIEKPAGKPMVIVSPALRAPAALAVKATVQVERALPFMGAPAKPGVDHRGRRGADRDVAQAGCGRVRARGDGELLAAVITCAGGVDDAGDRQLAVAVLVNAQVPPVSVIVTVGPVVVPACAGRGGGRAELSAPPLRGRSSGGGDAEAGKEPTVIVSPALSAPVALVKPIVQVERRCRSCGAPANVFAVGAVAAVMVTLPAGLPASCRPSSRP